MTTSIGFAAPCGIGTNTNLLSYSQSVRPQQPHHKSKPVQRRRRSNSHLYSMSALSKKYRNTALDAENADLVGAETNRPTFFRETPNSTRFPASWSETVAQVSDSVLSAAKDGHLRLRVDLRNPELVTPENASAVSKAIAEVPTYAPPPNESPELKLSRSKGRMRLLMDVCNATFRTLFDSIDDLPVIGNDNSQNQGPPRGVLFFDNSTDSDLGAHLLDDDISQSIDTHVFGEGDTVEAARSEIVVVLSPSNMHSDVSHIEYVEIVHYSHWNSHNIVVIINPSLIALTRHGSLDDEPRPPCFLSDYLPTYYIDPVAYIAKNATGALLLSFPRKWEMYLLKYRGEGAFRLIAEQQNRPSREKLFCEFSWRADDCDTVS